MQPRLSFELIGEVIRLLNTRDRRRLALYVIASFVVSLTEVVGVAAILPLADIMTGASVEQGYLQSLNALLGDPSRDTLVIILAAAIVLAFTLKAVLGLGVLWWGSGITTGLQVGLQRRLLAAFLSESYARHRQRNTAEVIRATGQAVFETFGKVLGGILGLLSEGLTVLMLLGLLLAVMPIPTLVIIAYLAVAMFLIERLLAPGNTKANRDHLGSAYDSSRSLLDSFQGFREVRMLNKEDRFLARFDHANRIATHASRRMALFQAVPKYALELVAVIGITIMLGVMSLNSGPSTVASLALFVAAAIRMLPSVTRITATMGVIRSGSAGAAIVIDTVREVQESSASRSLETRPAPEQGLLDVQGVTYQFPDGDEPVLKGVSLRIQAGSCVAFCGSSGSGKTTLVDLILGLQEPQEGQIVFGGEDIRRLGASWRDRVGYIPQDVYLLDASLAANIAFGETGSDIDLARVAKCLQLARLDDLVQRMPHGVHTEIGERGTRLSGGQRQRLGIARALYSEPSIIVMDEATSALDNETEDQIIQTILALRGQMTTIMVAHRLSTVRDVDKLYFLEDGEVTASGTFDEVRRSNARFAELVRLGDLTSHARPREEK